MNITEHLPVAEFERIKNFILEKGDRQTYRNFDSNNPHYKLGNFNIYLNPSIGQANRYSDPRISDFNEIVIQDFNGPAVYYNMLIVRKGDLENPRIRLPEGVKEDNVYLIDQHQRGIHKMKDNLISFYLKELKKLK